MGKHRHGKPPSHTSCYTNFLIILLIIVAASMAETFRLSAPYFFPNVNAVIKPYAPSDFSALTLLVGWQKGHPACKNTEWWGVGMVICLERGADLHLAQLMPLPLTVSCFSKIPIVYLSVTGSPR